MRYQRHTILPQFGEEAQRRLERARVLVVGIGGLGSPVARILAAAGVGHLVLQDHDRVSASNLARQTLFAEADVGRLKVDVAAAALTRQNPAVQVDTRPEPFICYGEDDGLEGIDVVVDGTDDYATRYALSDACFWRGIPLVSAALFRYELQVTTLLAGGGPCYRCVYPAPPGVARAVDCSSAGVWSPAVEVAGSIQASEVLHLLARGTSPLSGKQWLLDLASMETFTVRTSRTQTCAVCGENPSIIDPPDYKVFCTGAAVSFVDLSAVWSDGRWKDSVIAIDLREANERMPGDPVCTMNLPVGEALAASEIPGGADRQIVLVCSSGRRATRVAKDWQQRLADGPAVSVLRGGIEAMTPWLKP